MLVTGCAAIVLAKKRSNHTTDVRWWWVYYEDNNATGVQCPPVLGRSIVPPSKAAGKAVAMH